jgi:transcriptional regulator with XRE-family HTH domain
VVRGQEYVAEVSPTVRQRELGRRLRELRKSRDLTVEEVAASLLCSPSKISRAETGARRPSLRDVRDLCELYDVGQEESAQLMDLAREARQPSWWTRYEDIRVSELIGLEQEATAITCFCMYFVPALLQTEDYAAAMIRGIAPRIEPDILRQRVEARMRRQELLQRSRPPRYRAFLDEAVLRRQVGGAAVMKAQLDKILQLVEEGKATVQVIPYSVGAYAAVDSNFTLLEFSESSLPGFVYVEGLETQLYLEKSSELERYAESIEELRDAALTPRDTTKILAKIRDEEPGYH